MKKQKSILSFFQKPSQKPNGDNDENTSTDDLEFVKSDPVEEIRGTDTPAEKPPRSLLFPGRSRLSSPNCSGIGSRYYGSASLLPFSSVMHKFVKDPKHNGGNRGQDRGDSSACDLLSSRENGTWSYDRPKSHISRSSNSIDLVNPKILDFDHDSKDDLCGPETPSMQPLIPGLKRIQEDCRDVKDKHGFLLSESSKRMRLLRESSTVDHGQESPTKEGSKNGTSKFEWLNPSSIRDANRRRPGDPFYDKRTLYVPPDVLSKMSASQRQYWDVKRQYMDLVLFFKVGKFYELYELDAEIGQKELDWKMTHSGVGKCRQVGISEAGIDVAIERLTALGYKVGRMEQVETSDQAKARGANSVIQRKLVLVSTPATAMDGKLGAEAVHLLSLKEDSWRSGNCSTVYGFTFVDFAALKFWAGSICDDASSTNLGALLVQVSPKEVIYENGGLSKETLKAIKKYAPAGSGSIQLTPIPSLEFLDALEVKNFVHTKGYFKASSNFWSSAMESQENPNLSTCALGALISYLSRLKLEDALCSGDLLPYQVYKTCLKMNGQTLVNLEIFSNNVDGGSSGTLYRYLDRCTTPSGKRLLRRWISHPLTNIEEINDRLNVVEGLVKHQGISYIIPDYLRKLPDLERLLGRVKSHFAPSASHLLPTVGVKILKQQVKAFGSLIKGLRVGMDLLRLVVKDDHESVPFSKVLNLPVLSDLDEVLHQFEAAVQKDFPRYQDPDVKESDAEILSQLVEHFIVKVNEWSLIIHALSCIDVLNSFAMVSSLYGGSMCRPAILRGDSHSVDLCEGNKGGILKIKGLWHPYAVTEIDRTLVPNDVQLGEHSSESHPRALLLTGPNMGGKSTLLRATCLAVILAQLGCYVPCDSCVLSPVDVIFTRLGAMDRIMSGESTFFIECAETASILQHATQDSLVLLDELGRGTSTFDGYAIAYAVFRHLVEKVQCRLLFATHYHPLTKEFSSHPHVSLQHMACAFRPRTSGSSDKEEKDVVFLYRLMPGACPESYGLQVALMAGLPTEVVEAASQASGRLKSMVSENFKSSEGRSMFSTLHEDLLRSLLDVSMVEETGELDDDGFDTLLCLWHEVKSLYGGQMHKAWNGTS